MKKNTSDAVRTLKLPPIGALWNEKGGRFVGIGRRAGDKCDYALIVPAKMVKKDGSWEDNNAHAKALKAGGFTDWEPAQREDGHLCQANVPHLFEKKWYWLAPQSAFDERWAWSQDFDDGYQYDYRKDDQLRLFAVRRFPI